MKHKLHCTCPLCSGTGLTIVEQIEMVKPKHEGTRLVGAPDSERDKNAVSDADWKRLNREIRRLPFDGELLSNGRTHFYLSLGKSVARPV